MNNVSLKQKRLSSVFVPAKCASQSSRIGNATKAPTLIEIHC
jgi:hypothetical protein